MKEMQVSGLIFAIFGILFAFTNIPVLVFIGLSMAIIGMLVAFISSELEWRNRHE